MEGSVKRVISAYERDSHYRTAKRMLDITLSALALAVLWPFLLMLCCLIPLDSPGAGPIFVQTRVGKQGKPFRLMDLKILLATARVIWRMDGQ